jgi:septal ring factor EnvC (AmiA/AmiB activator)
MNSLIPTSPAVRRTLTALGVALSLVLGLVTIRAAGAWTAASAPLAVTPATAAEVRATLEQERARSASLQEQLDRLTTSTTELEAALAAAEARITQDGTDADALRASLVAARDRLAQLEASLLAARAPAPAPAAASTRGDDEEEHEDDEEEHEDEHDDD